MTVFTSRVTNGLWNRASSTNGLFTALRLLDIFVTFAFFC